MECNYVNYTSVNEISEQYCLNVNGVTKILRCEYSPEPFCTKFYVQVFIGDLMAVELHRFNEVGFKMEAE